ncbi:MAG: hypothetical protein EXS31_11360, partial [Pedosphaera sp.]|nr:hypothetical protein [Pedosphaera sp.]
MPARLPIQNKAPFEIDARPLNELASPHAGLLATSRAFRALKLPDLIAANLPIKERKRGFTEGQVIETLVLLQTAGGDCPEDIKILTGDPCLERDLGFAIPKVTALRSFLERFHDESLAALRPPREEQRSFIVPSSQPVRGLQQVQAGAVQRIAKLYAQDGQKLSIATIDQDATIIESHKQAALCH